MIPYLLQHRPKRGFSTLKGTLNNKAIISDVPKRSVEVATSYPGHYTNTHPTHRASGFSTKAPRQFVRKASTNVINKQ